MEYFNLRYLLQRISQKTIGYYYYIWSQHSFQIEFPGNLQPSHITGLKLELPGYHFNTWQGNLKNTFKGSHWSLRVKFLFTTKTHCVHPCCVNVFGITQELFQWTAGGCFAAVRPVRQPAKCFDLIYKRNFIRSVFADLLLN